jgi:hypothetical protein
MYQDMGFSWGGSRYMFVKTLGTLCPLGMIVLAFGCSGVSPNQAVPSPTNKMHLKIDKAITANLGAVLAQAISGARSISVATVGAKSTAADAIQGFGLDSALVKLDDKQAGTLRRLMLEPKSHVFGARARCRYRPKFVVNFKTTKSNHNILVSGSKCPKWSFSAKPKRKILDLRKPASAELVQLLEKVIKGGRK